MWGLGVEHMRMDSTAQDKEMLLVEGGINKSSELE
jgi:hypothetical protein